MAMLSNFWKVSNKYDFPLQIFNKINAEPDLGVPCGSVSPGMVDTEGVQDHVRKARALDLPHVKYFDEAFSKGWLTPMDSLASFVEHLLTLDPEQGLTESG